MWNGSNRVYINELHYLNTGPISRLSIKFRRNEDNVPVPVVLVGKNGSGKSILLSNIVDAFYVIANEYYTNASVRNSANGTQFYKLISPREIQNGKDFLTAYISFGQDTHTISYVFKSGKITFDEYRQMVDFHVDDQLRWNDDSGNYKASNAGSNTAQNIFGRDIVCYFGPDRYSRPFWLGKDYMPSDSPHHFSMRRHYAGELRNPITAENMTEKTVQWLFDIIADSRIELRDLQEYTVESQQRGELLLFSVARKNAESVMSAILGEDVIFRMNNRASGEGRFSICRPGGSVVVSSIDALSTGQLALFQMFATIIRYADMNNIIHSGRPDSICGIVIVDEIELHLHASLQREVLPRLIRMFPKIQFVITSHSPLFLLGMNEFVGEENYDIYEMPGGVKISAEQFSEFESAYRYFTDTQRFHKELTEAIERSQARPLIITEGATDWKHMKAAYEALRNDPRCSEWLTRLDFDFLEYEPKNSATPAEYKHLRWEILGWQIYANIAVCFPRRTKRYSSPTVMLQIRHGSSQEMAGTIRRGEIPYSPCGFPFPNTDVILLISALSITTRTKRSNTRLSAMTV